MMKSRILAVFLLVALAVTGCTNREAPALAPGLTLNDLSSPKGTLVLKESLAPDFTLNDLSGQPVQLSSLRGKVVLLNFWATWCPPCQEEVPSMVRLNQAMQGKPFQMLAVSIDEGGKGAVEAFFAKEGAALPTLLDTEGKVARLYGTTGVPETLVIDSKGVILKKVIGPRDWSAPEVLAALNELIGKN